MRSLAACVALAIGCADEPRPTGWTAPIAAPVDHLTADGLEEATRALTELGARQVATEQEILARDVVVGLLADAGLAVDLEPFTFDAWLPGSASITVGGDVFAVEALSPSPETHLTAALVDASDDFAGRIALFSSDRGSRAEQYLQAAIGGAAAFARITEDVDFDGGALVEVGHTLEGAGVPGIAVDHVVGERLRAAVGQEVTIDLAPISVPGHVSHNVVARVPGSGNGQVFVVAHYDSWHPSESAFDNAIGVGALVGIARQLAEHAIVPEREIVLIATSAEEQGLQGAIAWVDEHADEIGPGDVVVTLDVLWSGEGTFLALATDDGLRALAVEAASAEGLDVVEGGEPGLGSDHFPFVMQGAGAIWCGRWPDRHYHTAEDTLAWIDLDQAAAAMRSQWRVLADTAGFDPGT